MVLASVERSVRGVTDLIEDRAVIAVSATAALGAAGMALGQEVTDQVLPMLDRPVDPSSPADLGISAILKLVAASAVVAAGAATGGVGLAVAGGLGYGVLVSMGTDLIDVLQRGGVPGLAPSRSSRRSRPTRRSSKSRSTGSVRRSRSGPSAGRSRKVTADNGAFR